VWQALYEELAPDGLEIVTVALDTDREAARPFVEAARPTHPSLVDEALSMVDQFGITNVPFALWIDEGGTIVRPAEVAFPQPAQLAPSDEANARQEAAIAQMPEQARAVVEAMTKTVDRTGRYTEAIRDWVAHGADSRFVLSPDEVVERSRPRPMEFGLAAAHFELGQHLHRTGDVDAARAHFRAAHRLDPENWTYRRQAWSFEDPLQGPSEHYDSDWLSDVKASGAENYYPPPDL
jgi:tetratricopeptide (TPR) repeat protein